MDNRTLIGEIIGKFWPEVLGERIGAITEMHTLSADALEKATGNMIALFGEPTAKDTTSRMNMAVDVPTASIRRTSATGKDRNALYGDGLFSEQWADDASWTATLPVPVDEKPFISNSLDLGTLLIEGIDYDSIDAYTVRFYVDPATVGFEHVLSVVDGLPCNMYRMVLPYSGVGGGGYHSRYSLHDVPRDVRGAVFDLLAQEGSTSKILNVLQRAMGIKPPTVFERSSGDGAYTVVKRFWNDGGSAHGWTSGGELITVPLKYTPTFTHGSIIAASDSVTVFINAADRISDTEITGYWFRPEGTDGLVVLNTEEPLGEVEDSPGGEIGYTTDYNLQIRGARRDRDYFYAQLMDRLAKAGVVPSGVFDTEGKPVEQLYDRLGRRQPPAIALTGPAAVLIAGAGRLLQACTDNIPAGSGMVIDAAILQADEASLSLSEEITPFHVCILTDEQQLSSLGETLVQGAMIQ